ncbi:hypothetical protein DPMN_008480 [Dreissena polymorpha]|uniref:Uncharacterized protein n=1 Tax=Dreissena polymorpha TaxID=45954 RepID=A0A9D4MZE0_DREPO|nr:hypothetical protein DPMN_008480 [Dreissena polymorpha]
MGEAVHLFQRLALDCYGFVIGFIDLKHFALPSVDGESSLADLSATTFVFNASDVGSGRKEPDHPSRSSNCFQRVHLIHFRF